MNQVSVDASCGFFPDSAYEAFHITEAELQGLAPSLELGLVDVPSAHSTLAQLGLTAFHWRELGDKIREDGVKV